MPMISLTNKKKVFNCLYEQRNTGWKCRRGRKIRKVPLKYLQRLLSAQMVSSMDRDTYNFWMQ